MVSDAYRALCVRFLLDFLIFVFQIVGGPNERTDYHINETPEWFYQYKGSMLLKIIEGEHFRDVPINEGDMFLLPANTPHNPVRFANTVGIVLEQKRPANSVDRLRWYCQHCGHEVHEVSFHCTDLGTQIKNAVSAFKNNSKARTCSKCGEICAVTASTSTPKYNEDRHKEQEITCCRLSQRNKSARSKFDLSYNPLQESFAT